MRIPEARDLPLIVARLAFLIVLVTGVALHGGTVAWSQGWLEWSLIWTGVIYAVACISRREGLQLSTGMVAAVVVLAALGWAAACLPKSVYDASLRVFIPVSDATGGWSWTWGTVDAGVSIDTMRRITGMLGAFLIAMDMGRQRRWRIAILCIVAWVGASEALFGLAQKLGGDIGNYWGTVGTNRFRETAFGCFWYHGNAGAFLNLCWPVFLWVCSRELQRPPRTAVGDQVRRAACVLAALAVVSAVWINQSRAAHGVFLLQCVVGAGLLAYASARGAVQLPRRWPVFLGTLGAAVVGLAVLTFAFGMDKNLDRWSEFVDGQLGNNERWVVFRICARWFDQIPALGYGPGTFASVFESKTTGMAEAPWTYWQYAHNDYLQTFMEWGWAGLSIWLGVGLTVLWRIAAGFRSQAAIQEAAGTVEFVVILTALISVAVHAALDFPLQIFAIQLYSATLAGTGYGAAIALRGRTSIHSGDRRRRCHGRDDSADHAGAP